MGNRITWRGNPRNQYPWPLRTMKIQQSDVPAQNGYGNLLLGPLPMAAAVELIYRVREMEIVASTTLRQDYPEAPPPVSKSETVTVKISDTVKDYEILTEASHASWRSTQSIPLRFPLGHPSEYAQVQFWPINEILGNPIEVLNADIFQTPDKQFYLSSVFFGVFDGVFFDNVVAGSYFTEQFTATLILKAGTFSVPMRAGTLEGQPTGSTMTMTAKGWSEFATKDGLPAWDKLTGLPLNGGPGA